MYQSLTSSVKPHKIDKPELIKVLSKQLVKQGLDSNFAAAMTVGFVNNLPIETRTPHDVRLLLRKVSEAFKKTHILQ